MFKSVMLVCISSTKLGATHIRNGNRALNYIVWHWVWHKTVVIFQTTFSNAFSWMKIYEFRLRFHWSLFLRVQLTIFQHWSRLWLGPYQATSHRLNQWWLVFWSMYASLGRNELYKKIWSVTKENGSHSDKFLVTGGTSDGEGDQLKYMQWLHWSNVAPNPRPRSRWLPYRRRHFLMHFPEFWLKFHWSFFLRAQSIITQHWFR